MLFVSSTLLLLVNAVTLRRERSILFNRVAVLILLYSGIICYDSLNITSLDTGIGIYGGLFHSTSITHSFDLFICIIGAIVLQLTAYYPRRLQEPMGTTGKKKSFFLTNYASSSLEKYKNNMGEQSGVRKFSTSVKTSGLPLNPNFISGFTDGDGSFSVVITKCANRLGWTVSPIFTIGLHAKDLEFLNIIQSYFGVGKIYTKQSDGSIHYRVWSVKDLINIIIPHFDKYPLVTQKRADFELFKQIVQILAKKEKLTIEDLTKIVALKASINLGLSPVLKESFPNITPALRTVFDVPKVLDPHWLAGFIEAEGSFVVSIQKSYNNKNGFLTSLRFILSQHSRDLQLMNSIMKYFNCGLVYSTSTRGESVEFRMNKFLDVWNTLIPFLKKYPLQGSKLRDFSDFAKAAALMYSKDHLTIAGLDKIVNIKKGMNQLRQMSSMATAAVQPELKKERETLGWALIPEYPLIILFILIGAIFLMSSSDLVSMFLAIELQSYGLYIFATLYRNSELATSAGLTYFLLGGLSSCFILLGSCLLYLNFGITNLDGLYVLSSLSEVNGLEVLVETNQYFNLALLIMSVGYLFKVSAAPFHFWSPARWSGKSSMWDKLSNSGDTLELLVPSGIRKDTGGWTNHSCMVISQKASEKNVGYRGSKSDFKEVTSYTPRKFVKEQRVDGNWCVNLTHLRYTLLDFERNSQLKIPSNQIQQRRLYSTASAKKIDKAKILYSNVDLEKVNILQDNKGRSGVYMFSNIKKGKRYIGSSENLSRRFSEYINVNYLLGHNYMAICCALLKHGYSNFSLTILEYCEPEKCLIREKHFWDLLNPEYNIAKDPTTPMSGRKHSDETRQKMSDAHNSGQFKSGEMSGENNPMFGKPRAEGAGSPSQAIEVVDQKTNETTTYDSISEAARVLNIQQSVISRYFSNNQKKPYKKQYIFKKVCAS